MDFRILGPVELFHDGAAFPLGGPRHRMLFAILVLHIGQVVAVENLVDTLWGATPPATAAATIHVRISELRKLLDESAPGLGRTLLLTRRPGYLLAGAPEQVDANRFEHLAALGRASLDAGDAAGARDQLVQALRLWRGQALADVADLPATGPEAGRLSGLRLQATEDRIEADLALGRHREIVAELESLVETHPERETLRSQLMLALYRSGRQRTALEQFHQARQVMEEELGIEPGPRLRALHEAILRQDPALEPLAAAPPTVLPGNVPRPLSRFVGRDQEASAIRDGLAADRLLTLVGVGGVGKSRLAAEVAASIGDRFPDGVRMVQLAPMTEAAQIESALAALLGLREHPERPLLDLIATRLRDSLCLLVLDNGEHLVPEVGRVTRILLGACPGLRVLCTSRERLRITGEVVHRLEGLSVPGDDVTAPEAIVTADAVQLFVDRSASVRPGFRLTSENAPDVATICRRLDGLPLGIELAAARLDSLTVADLAARLDDRFTLLARGDPTAIPRHHSLRAVIDWSYETLDDDGRDLFDRSAVFVGSFTADAIRSLYPRPPADVPDRLSRLVDKSLILATLTDGHPARYRMLESLRAYGLERLRERGDHDDVRIAHAHHFRKLGEEARAFLRGPRQQEWLARLEADHPNLRAALGTSLETGDLSTAASLAGSIYPFWDLHGHYGEGRRWIARILDRTRAPDALGPADRARLLMGEATLATIQGDGAAAFEACTTACHISRAADDHAGRAHALGYLGLMAVYDEDYAAAETYLTEAAAAATAVSATWELGWAHLFGVALDLARDDHRAAARRALEAEQAFGTDFDPEAVAWLGVLNSAAAWRAGNLTDAVPHLMTALDGFSALGGLWGLSTSLIMAGLLAGSRERWEEAATMLGAGEATRAESGAANEPFVDAWTQHTLEQAVTALGTTGVRRAWRAGNHLPLPQRLKLARVSLTRAPQD